jgi:arylsulfatase A-like enzyme
MTRGRHPGFSRLYLSRDGGQAEADRLAVDQAEAQLERDRDRPFFMWVHLLSPHADYAPPPAQAAAFVRKSASAVKGEIEALARLRRRGVSLTARDLEHVIDLYDGEVAYADEQVGRLLAVLRALDLEKNTLVVLTADHGEDLYEHHRHFFHSPSIYGSSMRVPLVVALPGVLPAPQKTDHLASLVDIAPTILGLLGIPAPAEFAGQDLLPGGRLPERASRERVFGETAGRIHSIRSPEWRLVLNPDRYTPEAPGGPYPIAEVELYDLRVDPKEARNLAAERPEIVRALAAELQAFRARQRARGRPTEHEPEALEELRALGYLAQ